MGKLTEVKSKTVEKSSGKMTMQQYIKSMEDEIKKALPSVITPERFTRITLSALSSNKDLQRTTPTSFLGAMMTAAQLGLECNTPLGQSYLIPFKNKGILECQFQLGYKGLIDLAYRSGDITIIQAHTVCENDEFKFEYGMNPDLKHIPAKDNRGNPVYYYAMFKTKSGGYGFEVMSIEDIKEHAKRYSQSYGSTYSPWNNNFDEMAKKTVLKQALKYAPLKSDFIKQTLTDETVKDSIDKDMVDVPSSFVDAEYQVEDAPTETVKEDDIDYPDFLQNEVE